MTQGEYMEYLFFNKESNNFYDLGFKEMGSPDFAEVIWTGSIHTSKIVITFEYNTYKDPTTRVAKGIYRNWLANNGTYQPTWRVYRMTYLNQIYKNSGYLDTFGSRHQFTYQDETYYLVESSKINKRTKNVDNVILLADDNLIPLIELPIQLPGSLRLMSNFSAPNVRYISDNGQMATLAVSFQHRTPGPRKGDWNEPYTFGHASSFVYFVEVGLKDMRE